MIRIVKVTGESLSPVYQEGDYVVITTIPFLLNKINVGDAVVFKHELYGMMIKKVTSVDEAQRTITVIGLHKDSIDSRNFGPVRRDALVGKVIWHVHKPNN